MEVREKSIALCIPAYNASKYLPKILSSAIEQTIPFDEILVYNDCSTDNTMLVAKSYGAEVISGPENVGCSQGRLILAQNAKSEWIHFHDADDDLLPNFTTLAHKWIDTKDTPDVVLFAYEWRDYLDNELLAVNKFNKEELEKDPIKFTIKYQVNPFCGLYRRSKFLDAGGPDLDPNVLYNEDVAMHCKLARHGLSFSSESEVAIINFRVEGSMSRDHTSYRKTINSQFQVMKKNYVLTGQTYKRDIALKLWSYTRHAAWISDWHLVREILTLLKKMEEKDPINDSKAFRFSAKISPFTAVAIREFINRFKRKKNTFWY